MARKQARPSSNPSFAGQLESLEAKLPFAGVHEPVGLVAGNIGDSGFDLSWSAPPKGADSYLVAIDSSADPEPKCPTSQSVSSEYFAATGLDSSTTYSVRVCALNGNRVSDGVVKRIVTDPIDENVGVLGNFWEYPHKMAISDNGDQLVVWQNHLDSQWQLYYSRYVDGQLAESGPLSPEDRNVNAGMWNVDFGLLDVAAGDGGDFVVAWIDEDLEGANARVNVNRFMRSIGWDHLPGTSPTHYAMNDGLGTGSNGVNVAISRSGDAAFAVTEGRYSANQNLWVFYRESGTGQWNQIAEDGTLTDTEGGAEDTTQGGVPAMDMDKEGNLLVAFATSESIIPTSNPRDVHYAVYDRAAGNWGSGRQTITTGWAGIDTARVAVDQTTDLTSTEAGLRGRAGIAWSMMESHNVFGVVYYTSDSSIPGADVDFDHFANLNSGDNEIEFNGFDIADGEGHILATWTDHVANDQELVHFWFEDADQDGLIDSPHESDELDGRQVAGWKTEEVIVNDATILNSPYAGGNVQRSQLETANAARLAATDAGGLIAWSTLSEDAVHVRRILGYDDATQNVVLEGDATTEISDPVNHTLDARPDGENWQYADWCAAVDMNQSGQAVALHRSETDGLLHRTSFTFSSDPTPGFSVTLLGTPTTSEDGGQTSFEVVLDKQPSADVFLAITTDPTEGQATPASLAFDATNWDVPQTVIVNGVDDAELDGDIAYQVVLDSSSSVDPEYAGLSNKAIDLVNLDNENDPPIAADDAYTIMSDETLSVSAPGLLANDFDADGDVVLVNTTPVATPSGSLTLNSDGSLSYTPPAGFTGTDTFSYEIADGNGGTAIATVTIEVTSSPQGNPNDVYVWDISHVTKRRGKNTDLRIAVDINRDADADGLSETTDASAAQVLVTVELRRNDGQLIGTYSGLTDDSGIFQTEWIRGLSSGLYTAEVVDLAHATYDWNHSLDLGFDDEDSDGDGLPDELVSLA